MKRIFTLLLILTCFSSYCQISNNYYLPQDVEYDTTIPSPASIIGHQVGEWHVSHDRLVQYMYTLANASERITIQEYGQTFEKRPLLVLTITAEENQKNIQSIKSEHIKLTNPDLSASLNIESMPAVAYLGYSVHGNEPSGSNASMLVAYYLAAAQGERIDELLNNTVILLDPSFNPDGVNRFANYVNARKSLIENSDGNNMEQNEPWPRGRTNHYWFDLNRDWLPVQLPESQGRIQVFHDWKPNLLTDHHEMGTNSSFFFQPGIPSRNNPLTPKNTYTLTQELGKYHAKALDKIGSLYYTNESFDDYYYGKGSTYPDINGAVGILFEQASSRGHAQESVNGILRFPFTIRNHVTASLSSLEGIKEMRVAFLKHQRDFYTNAISQASKDKEKAYVFSSKDRHSAYKLAELIERHDIAVYYNKNRTIIDGNNYETNDAYVVPLDQPQYNLIKAMFEKRTDFQDSLFYDVSTWTLPLAFGVDYKSLTVKPSLGEQFDGLTSPKGEIIGGKSSYAYVFEWYDYYSPTVLNKLLKKNYRIKVATEAFYHSNGKIFEPGTILIPVESQDITADSVFKELDYLSKEYAINIYSFNTGLDYQGVSLGSPSFDHIKRPKVMLLVDGGVSSYDAGEVWHLFDQRYEMDLTLMPIDIFNNADIDKYNTILMVNGRYNDIDAKTKEKLKNWVTYGGTIVASKSALQFLNSNSIGKFEMKKKDNKDSLAARRYADISRYNGAQQIGGAIFEINIDNSNPIFYGYNKTTLPVFKNNELFMEKSKNPYANPGVYSNVPLLSGYISKENLALIKNSSVVGISSIGRGHVIGFTENMNFRAFWYGTNKVFINAVLFGNLLSRRASR